MWAKYIKAKSYTSVGVALIKTWPAPDIQHLYGVFLSPHQNRQNSALLANEGHYSEMAGTAQLTVVCIHDNFNMDYSSFPSQTPSPSPSPSSSSSPSPSLSPFPCFLFSPRDHDNYFIIVSYLLDYVTCNSGDASTIIVTSPLGSAGQSCSGMLPHPPQQFLRPSVPDSSGLSISFDSCC